MSEIKLPMCKCDNCKIDACLYEENTLDCNITQGVYEQGLADGAIQFSNWLKSNTKNIDTLLELFLREEK